MPPILAARATRTCSITPPSVMCRPPPTLTRSAPSMAPTPGGPVWLCPHPLFWRCRTRVCSGKRPAKLPLLAPCTLEGPFLRASHPLCAARDGTACGSFPDVMKSASRVVNNGQLQPPSPPRAPAWQRLPRLTPVDLTS